MRLIKKALTFDDVLLVPAYSDILPRDTNLSTRFTRDITTDLDWIVSLIPARDGMIVAYKK